LTARKFKEDGYVEIGESRTVPEGTSVAAVQLISGSDPARNVDAAIELIRLAASRGASYIQLPEYFNYLGPIENYQRVAETIPGPTTERLAALALELGVTVHIGSMLETSPEPGKFFNASVLLDPSGHLGATYRKAHLFDIDVPGELEFKESDTIASGNQLVVAECSGFRLGMSVCFDLRFPEMYRALALHGATVFAIPSAFNAGTGRAHWDVLVRARAIENHAFVVAAAQVGTTSEGIATFGHSMIVGPWGDVLAQSNSDGEDVLMATLDLDEVVRRRSQIDVMNLRRPQLYSSLDQ
jgi:predicted amidohydrolase